MPDPLGAMKNGEMTARELLFHGRFIVEVVGSLPTAGVEWRGHFRVVEGDGATTNDRLYWCRLLSSGSYQWTALL